MSTTVPHATTSPRSGPAPADDRQRPPQRATVAVAVLTTTLTSDFTTSAVAHLDVDLGGIPGDRHWGLTRLSDARERHHPHATIIRNRRQLSAVSVADCASMARALDITELDPGTLGANLLLDGVDGLSALPSGTRLQAPSGATLLVEEANPPRAKAGRAVAAHHRDRADLARRFVTVAAGLRGIVLSVERAGRICAGDALVLVP